MGSSSARYILFLALAWSSALLAGGPSPDQARAISLDDSMTLPEAQLSSLETAALSGDPEAAFRVYEHFTMPGDALEAARHWLIIAAENGHAIAQYNLWFDLHASSDESEQKRALFWLKRSADAGYPPAVEKFRSLKALPAKP